MSLRRLPASVARSAMNTAILLYALTAIAPPVKALDVDNKKPDMTSYTFPRHKEKTGEINQYRITIKIKSGSPTGSAGPANIIVRELFKTTVQDTNPNGEMTLQNEFQKGTVSFSGSEQDILRFLPVVTVSRDRSGHFTAKTQGAANDGTREVLGVMQQIAAMPDCLLPAKAIRIGDKWPLSFDNANIMIGGAKFVGEAEFVDTEQINGIKTLKINFKTADVTADNAAADKKMREHSEGTLNIDPRGKIIRLMHKGDGRFAMAPATVEINLDLDKPTDESKP